MDATTPDGRPPAFGVAEARTLGERTGAGEPVTIPGPLLHAMTNGAEGEAPPDDARGLWQFHAEVFRLGIAERLATDYVAAAGGSVHHALYLSELEAVVQGLPMHGVRVLTTARLTPEEVDEWRAIRRTLKACALLPLHLSGVIAQDPTLPRHVVMVEGAPVTLTPDDVAAAEALWADGTDEHGQRVHTLDGSAALDVGPHTTLPTAARLLPRYQALEGRMPLSSEDAAQTLADARRHYGAHDAHDTLSPLLSEWLTARGFAHFRDRVVGQLERFGREDAERATAEARARAEDATRAAAEALAREQAAREALEEERAKRKRPALRQGLGWLRATMQRPEHVNKARRKQQLAGKLTQEESEARRLFKYEPLGWGERLVVHALAAMARECKLLDAHPMALQVRPLADSPANRVQLPFPGIAELARVAGFEPDASGRIPKEVRAVIETALRALTTRPRHIAEPVLVPVTKHGKTKFVEDVRITQTLWVEASSTVLTRQTVLLLHPVAFASHLASYVPVGNLAARYHDARRAIGRRQMRDEWAVADDYLRYLAGVKLKNQRTMAAREGTGEGASRMVTVGDLTISADVSDETLREAFGIARLARDRGESITRERVEDALRFAQAMGTLLSYTLTDGTKGPTWRLVLANPGAQVEHTDPAQGLLFVPELDAEEAP